MKVNGITNFIFSTGIRKENGLIPKPFFVSAFIPALIKAVTLHVSDLCPFKVIQGIIAGAQVKQKQEEENDLFHDN